MNNNIKWLEAQKHEKYHWEKVARKLSQGAITQLDWYGWKANEFEKLLSKLNINLLSNNPKILEIGSGPIGIISCLNYGTRYSVDPLEEFYYANSDLIKLRNDKVCYMKGTGEKLPFDDSSFSIIIIDNVIDHTQDPNVVLKEILRTLNNNGIIYLSVNVHSSFGAKLHNAMNIFNIDTKHPHTYTPKKIANVLKTNRFKILYENVENYKEIRSKNIKSKKIVVKIKGYFGLSEIIYDAICMKE